MLLNATDSELLPQTDGANRVVARKRNRVGSHRADRYNLVLQLQFFTDKSNESFARRFIQKPGLRNPAV